MEKREINLENEIKRVARKFLEKSEDQEIFLVSHFDTDGITSAAIMTKALKRLDKSFSVKIIKSLEKEFIKDIPKNKLILFLDLASGSFDHIKEFSLTNIFIIDHHEIIQEIPEGIEIINPQLHNKEKISSSCLTYLFCKEINPKNKDLAKLAILGMIGDRLEGNVDKLNHGILEEGEIQKKRGLLIYPSTRPINRVLEYCSNPYLPEITGNIKGVLELLREIGLNPSNGKYKSLMELDDKEMQKLITAIMLRNPKAKNEEIIGDIFLIKLFGKLEDARELSAKINACSRSGESDLAIMLCMENKGTMQKVDAIHTKYKQSLISGLKFASTVEKIQGNGFTIINAEDNIKDTMIGTIASILSNSPLYQEGTIITAMAYYEDKIKVSARNVGREGRNVREVLNKVVNLVGGEVGGHEFAAGCIIKKEKEEEFINHLKKHLEIEIVKI